MHHKDASAKAKVSKDFEPQCGEEMTDTWDAKAALFFGRNKESVFLFKLALNMISMIKLNVSTVL